MSDSSARKIDAKAMLSTAERQVGIRSTDKIILEVQLDAQAKLQETIEVNSLSMELLTKRIGLMSICIAAATLVVGAVGAYLTYLGLSK